jgi:hypothetical protein
MQTIEISGRVITVADQFNDSVQISIHDDGLDQSGQPLSIQITITTGDRQAGAIGRRWIVSGTLRFEEPSNLPLSDPAALGSAVPNTPTGMYLGTPGSELAR